MIASVERHIEAIRALCQEHNVRRLDRFGSAAAGDFDPSSSDLDFVAMFADTRSSGYVDRYLAFAEGLEALFEHPVDVLIENMIRGPYFREDVEATRTPVYPARGIA